MDNDNISSLKLECGRSEHYPGTILSTQTPEHTLNNLVDQLRIRKDDLFCSKEDAAVAVWELARFDEGYRPYRFSDMETLRSHFELHFNERRADPRQRFVFIEAPHSRDPLSVTSEMFLYIVTYLQAIPSFLELVFPFGLQHYARGFHFSACTAENHLVSTDRGLCVPSLRRSGLHMEICYSLKSVERTPDPNNPWSIRQCSVQHRFDLESEVSSWVVVKGNSLIQNLIKSQTNTELTNQQKQSDTHSSAFSSSLKTHSILAAWSGENWHWYIDDLEERLQSVTRPTVAIPMQRSPSLGPRIRLKMQNLRPRRSSRKWSMRSFSRSMRRSFSWSTIMSERTAVADEKPPFTPKGMASVVEEPVEEDFSFQDMQTVQFIHEKTSELLLILKSNSNVLASLGQNYSSAIGQAGSMTALMSDGEHCNQRFQRTLNDIIGKMNMQQSRVETLLQLIAERKTILHAILQHRNMEANNRLAQEAKISAKKMEEMTEEMHEIARKTKVETVSMRTITLVTLFFLPGTFISTLMSTPIVNFGPDSSGFSGQNIGFGALQFFLVISLPLVCLTFAAWYVVYWREKRKGNRTKLDPGDAV